MRRAWLVMLWVSAAVLLSGCATHPVPTVVIQPSLVAPGQALHVSVSGLSPHALATVRLSTSSSSGPDWSSEAVFRADGRGRVSTSQAPVGGDYAGARPDGLEEALHAPRGDASPFAAPKTAPWRMSFTVSVDDSVVARAGATRRICLSSVTIRRFTLAQDHVLGLLYEPKRRSASAGPAVVAIGGSEGGYGSILTACDLAAEGIPTLAVAYFHEPGLPDHLEQIPLEYFATAARLPAGVPGVDPDRVVLWGDSRGSEAAALTAAHYPALVHGVVLTVPGAVAAASTVDQNVAAWTYRGKEVPTAGIGSALHAPAAAALPVEAVNGPILAVCAGKDAVWPSCPQSAQLRTRLHDHGKASRFTLLAYPSAGHFIGSLYPHYPGGTVAAVADGDAVVSGGTALADAEARDDAWPHLLSWLHKL